MSLGPEEESRIDEEENTLQEVLTSLEQQFSYSHSRLRVESARASELTKKIVASRRDVDKQMLASDEAVSHKLRDAKRDEIKLLDRLLNKPYFARIVLDEETENGTTREVEYKLGVAANTDCRIIDWRKAPIAKLFYEYQEGEEFCEEIQGRERSGTIRVRNKVDIDKGELRRISCGLGAFERVNGSWQKVGFAGPDFKGTRGGLPNVLQLITAEQFQMITEDAEAAVLIQGIAGSGKTTVALYRLAWLLHEDNSSVESDDALILVYSKTLKRYIQDALPSLNISDLKVLTFAEWAEISLKQLLAADGVPLREITRPPERSHPGIRRVKRGMGMLLRLEEYVEELRELLVAELREHLPWNELPKSLAVQFDLQAGRKNHPLTLLSDVETSIKRHLDSGTVRSAASAALQEQCRALLRSKRRQLKDYRSHILAILSRPDQLLSWDDSSLLDRELIESAYKSTKRNFESNWVDTADDALLLRLSQLIGDGLCRPNGTRGLLEHIVADEVQDLGATELAVIIHAVEETSQLTLVGDSAQEVSESQTFPGWDTLRSHWSLDEGLAQFHSLTVSHRSTLQIMRLADYVSGQSRTTDGRKGKPPIWFKCRTENRGVSEAINWLQRVSDAFPGTLAAVLCANPREAAHVHSLLEPTFGHAVRIGDDDSFSFEEGIVVTDIRQVKGLEFPHVLIWNPSRETFPDVAKARNALYVAVTRAQEHLCLVTWGRPSRILPSIDSKLVRGYEQELEDE